MEMYEAFGEKKTAHAWSLDGRCQVTRKGFVKRVKAGWDVEEALSSPPKTTGSKQGRSGGQVKAFGEMKSTLAWSQDPRCKVSRTMLRKRLQVGMTMEEALSGEPTRSPEFVPREAFGEQKPLAEWVRDTRCNVGNYSTVLERLAAGWEAERALVTPAQELGERTLYEAWDEEKTVNQWCKDDRCVLEHPATLHSRINKAGMAVEDAITSPLMKKTSMAEGQVADFVETLGLHVERNAREPLKYRFEIDIYVPEKQLGIEFHGLYWHSERQRGTTYHRDKWVAAQECGIRLIQVWEDDWERKRPIVESMLRHKLGRSDSARVSARSCVVDLQPDKAEVRQFLEDNHLQGDIGYSVAVGLRSQETLVAVCTFLMSDSEANLNRYATNCHVIGGFQRCLAAFKRNWEWTKIKTFADLCVSDGDLYEQSGFTKERILKPDYMYVVKGKREHKFNYRLKRFRSDPNLIYVDGMSEKQLAELNGLPRIYDAGKIRYAMT